MTLLTNIKSQLGLALDQSPFDAELLGVLNNNVFELVQAGVPLLEEVTVDDSTTLPDQDDTQLNNAIQFYLYLKVKQQFDPSTNATVSTQIDNSINQVYQRIIGRVEYLNSLA